MKLSKPAEPWDPRSVGFVYPTPRQFVGGAEHRLIPELRTAAQSKDPKTMLARAAASFLLADQATTAVTKQSLDALGVALADLAATGRQAYSKLRDIDFTAGSADRVALGTDTRNELPSTATTPAEADLQAAMDRALDRTYTVAWALRGPVVQRVALRGTLGWIAVSGEDDKPHRPVNVPAPPYEQHEVLVPVRVSRDGLAIPIELSISTRYIVAPADGALAPPQLLNLRRTPNDLPPPTLPSGDEVILFVHGHSSGAEEAVELIPHLIQAGLERGKKYSVISLDLPNNGYSDTFHDTDVALESSTSYPDGPPPHDSETIKTPILDFIDDFIVSFVDELDKKIFGPAGTPIRDRMVVIGGSLGGNMGLRLGRRSRPSSPWVAKNIVAWSAASVWKPMLKAPAKNGPKHCMVEFTKAETDDARENYFRLVYDHVPLPLVIKQQPEYWYRSGWNAKDFQILLSRIARREIYNENYRRWHWRVAGEQLVYSHLDNVEHGRDETPKRYELNTVRTLLVAGEVDNYSYVGIYDGTRQLAEAMTTPGRLLLVKDSGHSIHFEYPRFLADQIARFLNAREMQIDRVGREGGRIERVGGTNVNDGTPFVLTRQECIDAINRGDEFFVTSASGEEILVRVVGTYIRSTADHEEDNNLGALPDL